MYNGWKKIINKEKFLVNEPIEIDLSINGTGALELYEEPSVFESPMVENFDSTSDFVVNKDFTSTKSFKITYLARAPGVLPAKKMPLVFFDSKTLRFVTREINIPKIQIAGTSISQNKTNNDSLVNIPENRIKKEVPFNLNPIYKVKNTVVYNRITLVLLILIIFILALGTYLYKRISFKRTKEDLDIFAKILKYGASYPDFYELIQKLGKGFFISIEPVPILATSSNLFMAEANNSSSEDSCSFFAEFKIPPPFFATSS